MDDSRQPFDPHGQDADTIPPDKMQILLQYQKNLQEQKQRETQQAEQRLHTHLKQVWADYTRNIEQIQPHNEAVFKAMLPSARVKKMMQIENMMQERCGAAKFTIGNDAPIVLAKACEFFVAELSCHSWVHAGKRVTLQQTNIAAAVRRNELFEFLVDIVPPNEQSGAVRSEAPPLASAAQQDQEADAATARTSAVIDQLLQSMQASQASAQAGNFAAGESGASAIVTTASDRGDGSSSAQGINSGGGLASAPLQSELPTEPPAKRIRVDWDCP